MPTKLGLDRESYFIVQRIYNGWALFGVAIIAEILLDIVLAVAARPLSFAISLTAFAAAAFIALGLIVFFIWVQPANSATGSWARPPQDWEQLRRSWEWGHLTIALLTSIAFGASAYNLERLGRVSATAPDRDRSRTESTLNPPPDRP